MLGVDFISHCAVGVAPSTIQAIVQVESQSHSLALHINGLNQTIVAPNPALAISKATSAIQQGYSVDLGLMQVNNRNLASLGYGLSDMFDPCKNLAAGASILHQDYDLTRQQFKDKQVALKAALSLYNSGKVDLNSPYLQHYQLYFDQAKPITPAINAGTFPPSPPQVNVMTTSESNPYRVSTRLYTLNSHYPQRS